MTHEEAIAIIRKEYLCVDRDCDIERSCGRCDLMMPSKEPILEAFKMAMQALEQQPKWIPVSERLPKDNDYKPFSYYEDGAILFCTKDGKMGFGWYYESTKEWANEDDRSVDVIAWMPLPPSYQGE